MSLQTFAYSDYIMRRGWLWPLNSPLNHAATLNDLVCVYLAMPFGWSGAPARFARFGDAVTRAHRWCGPLDCPATLMRRVYVSFLYVDGGIFVEVNVPERLYATTQ